MKKILWLVALVLVAVLVFWAVSAITKVSDEDRIKTNLTAMWTAIEQGDIEKYASWLHPDFTAFGESEERLTLGKEAEVQNVKAWLEHAKAVHTTMQDAQVRVVGKLAWITYYWSDSGVLDGRPFSSRGKSTRIFIHEDDRWLCIHAHHTLLPTPVPGR